MGLVYYSKIEARMILLLGGGDKSTQESDIKIAKVYLVDHRKRHDKHVS